MILIPEFGELKILSKEGLGLILNITRIRRDNNEKERILHAVYQRKRDANAYLVALRSLDAKSFVLLYMFCRISVQTLSLR